MELRWSVIRVLTTLLLLPVAALCAVLGAAQALLRPRPGA